MLERYRHKGYGTTALKIFMDRITEITGNSVYKFMVDIDNVPSQKLIRKIGGIPDGIVEFLIHGDALIKFKEDNKDMINEDIIRLASEFSVEPTDLIGMVLQFRVNNA